MRCPNCQRENQPDTRFCIFCGSPLPAPGSGEPQDQTQALQEEVRHLREIVAQMNNRLAALESRQGITAPAPPPAPAATRPEAPPVPAARIPPPGVKPARAREREWEQILGGSWLARIGVLALVIGIGFFLKFAFDNDWIGPTGQVVMGIIVGLAMLGLGYYWSRRYPVLTRVLSGGGIAVLYLSIFASFAIYNLVHFYVAFAFLLVVSVASAALALRYNSMALAIIGIFGAFAAPFLLGGFGARNLEIGGASQAVQFLVYIIVVDLGVLFLSTFRNWRWFTLLALVCSLISFGFWYGEFDRQIGLATAEVGITIIFLIFVGATTLFHSIWRRVPQSFDYTLMVINAAAYFGISLGLMWDNFRLWMGGFVLVLTLFYGVLSYVILRRSAENVRLSLFSLGIALVFLTVAIPVQLGHTTWTTIAWAVEGAVLIWLAAIMRVRLLRWYSYIVFFIVAVRLMFFDTGVTISTFQPVLNERFLAFVIGIAAFYLAGYLSRREIESSGENRPAAVAFFIAANFLSIWIISFEVWNYFDSRIYALRTLQSSGRAGLQNAQNLSLTAVWAVYAVIGLVVGIVKRWRYVRLGALALLAVPIIKVFVYDVFKLELAYRIGAFGGLGLLLLVSAYLYQRYSKIIKGVFIEK